MPGAPPPRQTDMAFSPHSAKKCSTVSENSTKGRSIPQGNCSCDPVPCVSCTTFNILAPIYKRLSRKDLNSRESEYRAYWFSRNEDILDRLVSDKSSIICLQEFWVGNQELVDMYESRLSDAGYANFKLARTNNRGDGLLTAIHSDYFRIISYRELLFNDFGDRVAQLLHIEMVAPFWYSRRSNVQHQLLVVNTHLLFPHNSSLSIVRLRQVCKILKYVEAYKKDNKLKPMPVILCGDWNGSKRGHVYKFLRSQGFFSSYDTAHHYTDNDADAHKWVSHRNHRGNICGVDFIWLRNPGSSRKPLVASWREAVLSIVKHHLCQICLTSKEAYLFLKGGNCGDCITYSSFFEGLNQLGLTDYELNANDLNELWRHADADGDDAVDYEEFQKRIWNPWQPEQMEEVGEEVRRDGTISFHVKNAVLLPPEVERGLWPEHYSLSDHARLTVEFSPRQVRHVDG